MNLLRSLVFLLFMASPAVAAEPNTLCIATKCGGQAAACALNTNCRTTLSCVQNCKQTDPEEKQICNILCTESTPTPQFDNLSACMVEKQCLGKVEPTFCARPRNSSSLVPLSLAELEGPWYVIQGLSRVYDCWPCQKMDFTQKAPDLSAYDYSYRVSKTTTHISCSVTPTLDAQKQVVPGEMTVNYKAHGVDGKDDWYIVSRTDDFVLIYYCGLSAMDSYRGAVVMARMPGATLPVAVYEQFQKALQAADLEVPVSLGDFCSNDTSSCGF